ncbi:MAG: Tm-1-like ATP-binding domain-containing protein [Fuerstiella sp.]
MSSCVYAIATMDTKGDELAYVKDCLISAGIQVRMVDVGTAAPPTVAPDVSRTEVVGQDTPQKYTDRGAAIAAISRSLTTWLSREHAAGRVSGVIGIGGSGGTSLISAAMRALPVGLPKLLVSTVASGNTAPYVDCSDITMMYPVVDVAGLNVVSRCVLANAAHAMAGMVRHMTRTQSSRPALGMTMFGVTTPCVTRVRESLEAEGFDALVFHATGSGGRAMEKLVESGLIRGVLDITTTEVADEIAGGVFPAGPARFDTILDRQIPCVMSLGACDMVNFGAKETVPERYAGRLFHGHNEQVTLMRTTPEENRRIARWIARKLNQSTGPVTVLIPENGVSMLDAPGQPFFDREADAALFEELEVQVHQTDQRRIIRLPHHINDPEFADHLVKAFLHQETRASETSLEA